MIAVWLTSHKLKGRKRKYSLCWQMPELDANGQPVRYAPSERFPNGRPKMIRYRERCNTTDSEEADAMRERKRRLLNGLDVPAAPVKHVTLDALAGLDAEWLRNRDRAAGTIYLSKLALTQLQNILKKHGRPVHADTLTPADVELFIAERRQEVKAKAVNGALSALRATFNRACKHAVLGVNPFEKMDRLQETPRPIIPLTTAEEAKLLAACAGDLELETFVRLALDTGARAGELSNLKVADLDLDNGLGRLECNTEWKTKTRRNRQIAFTPATAAVVRQWLARRPLALHVFRNPEDRPRAQYDRVSRRFSAAVERAGIGRDVTLQDCRRTVGSLLAERGVNQRVAMEYLGHSSINTTARFYQAVRADTLKAVVVNLRGTGTEG